MLGTDAAEDPGRYLARALPVARPLPHQIATGCADCRGAPWLAAARPRVALRPLNAEHRTLREQASTPFFCAHREVDHESASVCTNPGTKCRPSRPRVLLACVLATSALLSTLVSSILIGCGDKSCGGAF